MDDEPDYRFVCSQAAQQEWMRVRHPGLFARMQEKAAAGQWIPVGGMWVEADMNLPSGESIVRQLVHGQRFFEEHFGRRCREVWIPDVFGYPASLPQLFAAGGCTRFVTQKLSWNKENRFPHSTFWWEGIDGTRVLTHFPPVETYNAEMEPAEQVRLERQFHEHGWSDWSLTPYGYGDGGGGPTREMVGRARRMADLDGLPRLELGTVDGFFASVEGEAAAGAPVPTWRGELYFEMHRGTLTSQIRTKLGNRTLRAPAPRGRAVVGRRRRPIAADRGRGGRARPAVEGRARPAVPRHPPRVVDRLGARRRRGRAHPDRRPLGGADRRLRWPTSRPARSRWPRPGAGRPGRSSSRPRLRPVERPGAAPARRLARLHGRRPRARGDRGRGGGPWRRGRRHRSLDCANRHLAVAWDDTGALVSVRSLDHDRELLRPGRTVALELAPDHPVEYDAWDLESWTRRLGRPLTECDAIEVLERGPLLGAVRVTRTVGPSTFATTYRLAAGSTRLDVVVDVDWHHDEHLLSLAVPLDVHTDEAVCDIQLGHVRRPTHASSSWDAAKFEVCAHRFVDLAEPSFGVAVLNDGRYGHALQGDAVRVSLLRAAKYPDPAADHGRHQVTIALLPHGAGLHEVLQRGRSAQPSAAGGRRRSGRAGAGCRW